MPKHTLIVVEDEEGTRASIRSFFTNKGYGVVEADSVAKARKILDVSRPDAAIVDYLLPDGDGLEILRSLKAVDTSIPVVILTAHGSIDLAVRAIKEGAEQFLTKPVELSALLVLVERILEHRRNRRLRLAGESRQSHQPADPFLGDSPGIRLLAEQAQKVSRSQSRILIQGETGTGKGLLASWLHRNGPRADEAFVDLNCASLSREFLETELFGHEKGAYTGAVTSKPGLLEIAHRGTLFLDEIGDLDLPVQPKLLKVLEEQRFRRLGDVRDRRVDVGLIAASHQDLKGLVRERKFRGDLFYRINTIPLFVPALRDRGRDVTLLARSLLEQIAADQGRPELSLSGGAERALEAYSWPGNIRELRNVLERAVLLGERTTVEAKDLSEGLSPDPPAARDGHLTLQEAERRHIEEVLREEEGYVPRTASILGLSRSALYQKIKKHQIPLPGVER